MHALHVLLSERERLRSAVFSLSEQLYSHPLRLGLVLDLNPLWLGAYAVADAGLGPEGDLDPVGGGGLGRLADLGLTVRTSSPAELRQLMASDIARWKKVVADAHIEAE